MSTQLSGPVMVSSQGLYTQTTTAYHNLGELVFTNDGRAFRYARNGATALVSARLVQAKAENTSDQDLTPAAASAAAIQIVTTSTVSVDANEYANGFAVITTSAGSGKVYKISSHAAATAVALTINISDPIEVALTTGSRIDLVANPYSEIIINPATVTSAPIGVTTSPLSANNFGWLGVSGPQPCWAADAAVGVGSPVVASNATAGGIEIAVLLQSPIGTALSGIASGEVGLVNVHLL